VTATVTLPAGQQVLTLDQDSGGWNINYMTFTSGSGGGTGIGNGTTYTPQWCPQWCQEFNRSAGSPDTTVWNFDLGNNTGGATVKSKCTADLPVIRTTRLSARRRSVPLPPLCTSMGAGTW